LYFLNFFKFLVDYEIREPGINATVELPNNYYGWAEIRAPDIDPGKQFIYFPTECHAGCDVSLANSFENYGKEINKIKISVSVCRL